MRKNYLSDEKCNMYREDSIFVQPTNKRIQERPLAEIIGEGSKSMQEDGYRLGEVMIDV